MVKEVIEKKTIRAYKGRMESLKKKAMELTTLCGSEVCFIYFGSEGEFETWPEDVASVNTLVNKYRIHQFKGEAQQMIIADLKLKVEEAEKEIAKIKTENQKLLLKISLDIR